MYTGHVRTLFLILNISVALLGYLWLLGVHDMEGKEENSPEWMRQQLEIQLSLLIRKYWCGQYQSLHPKLFKQVLGTVHPQLNGFRQVCCSCQGNIY